MDTINKLIGMSIVAKVNRRSPRVSICGICASQSTEHQKENNQVRWREQEDIDYLSLVENQSGLVKQT
jgi:hypothetical protein